MVEAHLRNPLTFRQMAESHARMREEGEIHHDMHSQAFLEVYGLLFRPCHFG
jgi:hypothetical protein